MSSSSPSTIFPPLKLSATEERAIADEAALIIQRTLVQEAEFQRQGGKVDQREWKQVRVEDGLAVYKQRKVPHADDLAELELEPEISAPELLSNAHSEHSGSRWRFSSFDIHEFSATTSGSSSNGSSGSKVPMMLAAGHIEGNLEDAMLGIFDGDDLAWKVRAALLKDRFEQAHILATIRAPTDDEPFNFLGIKWFSIEYPPIVGSFIQKRDTLVIETQGIATDENGEQYGYSLFHDFRHPSLPELKELGMLRSKITMCFVFRQSTPTRVTLYARGFVDGGGDLPKGLGIAITAMSILSNANAVETSYARKLAWLVNARVSRRRLTQEKQASSSNCHSCGKTPLFRDFNGCHVCGCSFCSKCTVHRKVVLSWHDATVHSLSFCHACVLEAKNLSPVDYARAVIVPRSESAP
ncbi:hypothetical protein Poli38472_012567 [Pythium oligandrum]|uniref:FYVE-type domain-containing protein n=1 Tax=Pythium oligandrum TaxID=41045 RepID=A0A8K1CEH1_PYTOL|nr:hypothetical protein Poli38472_012567 [Pythium oligandrum]|eukprot:TMW61376.1 hypothetical protein Poli38472_012567 [Pythium oligandrum]